MKRPFPRLIAALIIAAIVLTLIAPLIAPGVLSQEAPAVAEDTSPPVIELSAELIVGAADGSGTIVDYRYPAATDDIDGPVAVVCDPPSGSRFPLGTTEVRCTAADQNGNQSDPASIFITVLDQQAPVIGAVTDVTIDASDHSGVTVDFAAPVATDNVDGYVAVGCHPPSGSLFAVGVTSVRCWASDMAGNAADPVMFSVTVNAPPEPTPIPTQAPELTPTLEAVEHPTPPPADEPDSQREPELDGTATSAPDASGPADSDTTPAPDLTPKPGPTREPEMTPTPASLPLPASLPPPADPIYGSGPVDGLALIWGGLPFRISQEYGHTAFSLAQETLYLYGRSLGLDGRAHPGLDIGMPAGTYLYSPVNGTVIVSGGVPYYTYYGNGGPGVGELLIETEAGDEVILGHMAAIAVGPGERVTTGQFVGLSGGENGDHLHLEARAGGFLAVDPRLSFIIDSIAAYGNPPISPVCGETIVIGASADAWISEAEPWRNGGADDVLAATTGGAGQAARILIEFSLPGAMPEECAIASATLELTSVSSAPDVPLDAYSIASAWNESLVTWESQPPAAGEPARSTAEAAVSQWDVSEFVRGSYAFGHSRFLIRGLESERDGGPYLFASRESGNRAPRLVIHYAVFPDTTILSGPAAQTSEPQVRFMFSSSSPDVTFECALDGNEYRPCEADSILIAIVAGEHRLDVRAVTVAGAPDPTPARHTWTYIPPGDYEQASG